MSRTENGAKTNKSSGNALLDLFFVIGSSRDFEGAVIAAFERAFIRDPALAIKILLWSRDCRGGSGERKTFRHILHWLDRRHPDVAKKIIASGIIEDIGRWDDYFSVGSRDGFNAVIDRIRLGWADQERMMAKWLPRNGPMAVRIMKALGVSPKAYRAFLSRVSETVEQDLCAGRPIRYKSVPSVAAARYQRSFRKHDFKAYEAYLDAVSAGTSSMKAGVVFPHDITKAARLDNAAATVQWSQLPWKAILGDALVLCDVSGSMERYISRNLTYMDVCVAMGLYLSERLEGPFKNQVLTFTSQPAWHTVTGETLSDRINSLKSAKWAMNTNIQAAYDAILKKAKEAEPGFKMPKCLVVLSDMEFDDAGPRLNHTILEHKFKEAGFPVPKMVYWNLRARPGNVPSSQDKGSIFVSGYSPAIMSSLMDADFDGFTPMAVMLRAVDKSRYSIPGLC